VFEIIAYRSHLIRLKLVVAGNHTYSWRFQINGGMPHICEHAPHDTEAAARDEALTLAKLAIDRIVRS
jgi:hypothetical protein